jgi:hypothetical protein
MPKTDAIDLSAVEAVCGTCGTPIFVVEGEVCAEIAAWLRQMADEERKRAKWADEAALDVGDVPLTLEGDKIRFGARALCAAAAQLEDGSWRQHAPKGDDDEEDRS